MQNEFPVLEKVEFEEIYGQNHPTAQPYKSYKQRDIFTPQTITANDPETTPYIFTGTYKEIEIQIRKHTGYISLKDLKINYPLEDVIHVYRMLEYHNLINNNTQISYDEKIDCWSKQEIYKLLSAIDQTDDWNVIEKQVGRSKPECILQFLKFNLNSTKLVHDNPRMAQLVFLSSKVHPKIASVAAKEFIKSLDNPNFENVIEAAKEQLELEREKLLRLEECKKEALFLRINEKVKEFNDIIVAIDNEKNELKEEIIDYEKDIKEVLGSIKQVRNGNKEMV